VLPPPSPPVIKVAIVHESIVKSVQFFMKHRWRRRIGTRQSVIVAWAIHGNHDPRGQSGTCPTTRCDWSMTPLSGNRIAATNVASYQLVATPRSLDHLDGLAVRKASMTSWAAVGRRNQGLIGVPVRTVEKIRKEAAGLTHGNPRVSASWRVVEGTAAHVEQIEVGSFELVNRNWMDGLRAPRGRCLGSSCRDYRQGLQLSVERSEL
jgi:hypothetical protein